MKTIENEKAAYVVPRIEVYQVGTTCSMLAESKVATTVIDKGTESLEEEDFDW